MAIRISGTAVIDDSRNLANIAGIDATTKSTLQAAGLGGIAYTKKTANYTAVNGDGIIADTTAGAFTVTLPASPSAGNAVYITDGGAWGTNNLTVGRNGSTIEGAAENLTLDITGAAVQCIFDGTTWQVYAQVGAYGTSTTGTGAVVLANSATMANVTITTPTISSPTITSPTISSPTITGNVANITITTSTISSPTITSPTISNATINDGYTEETATANTSTAYTIDLANGTLQVLTLTGSCTFTFPTATAGKSFTLFLKQDATGSRTVTWPASVKWPSGTAPTITSTASKGDKFVFTADGTYWWGSTAGQNYL